MSEPVTIRWDELPKSFNAIGMSTNSFAIANEKKRWEAILGALLAGADGQTVMVPKPGTKTKTLEVLVQRDGDLPKPCSRITVEGRMTFPDRRKRDQGNYRVMVEKALGDALVLGGYLADDDWSRYEFGGLAAVYAKGVSRTELVLFPWDDAPEPDGALPSGAQLGLEEG